jgi:putative ABC transport system ATP-binding protein
MSDISLTDEPNSGPLKKSSAENLCRDRSESSNQSTAVDLIGVKKSYSIGDQMIMVLKGIDLRIEQGEFVALMGPSGSGKSTLMNIIGCLDRPSAGQVLLHNKDISMMSEEELARVRREEIGFIFQTFNLIGRITVLKNVELPMIFREVDRVTRRKRAISLLEAVGLGHRLNYSPMNLSGGERQRVAIARALANNPPIIIADEPTGNLDLKNSAEIMDLLNGINAEGRTIIMVTHNPEITSNCTRTIRLRDGLVAEGST